MKIKINGKTTAALGNSTLKVKGRSGKKYPFQKKPKVGYTYEAKDNAEVLDIFEAQNGRYAYFFTPVLGEEKMDKPVPEFSLSGLDLEALKDLCEKLGIETIPQDKERSLTRLLKAWKQGYSA